METLKVRVFVRSPDDGKDRPISFPNRPQSSSLDDLMDELKKETAALRTNMRFYKTAGRAEDDELDAAFPLRDLPGVDIIEGTLNVYFKDAGESMTEAHRTAVMTIQSM